ncbi:hypothetical protein ATANTOWER_009115 [Ataeniobius toweri]|uniref:Uncharacterized protein n=1 Tax=Ataeniobius toweri TaxID=208326 RepID=A0ABU7C760_9TELE|nr:hypothetical protein [Ataeniobius toweri]
MEGFECSNDPRGYVVWGLNAPGRVSHGKQTKSSSRHPHEDHYIEARDVAWYVGAGVPPWSQARDRERLVVGLLLAGPGRAKPKRETRGHPPVGPPPAGGPVRDRCKEDWQQTKVETLAARSPDA